MDKEPEEMQNLGVVGIIKEAYKLMRSYGRLLASITVTLVLPLCFVVLAHRLVSDPLMETLKRQGEREDSLAGTAAGEKLKATMDKESFKLFGLAIFYILFVLAFSLLSYAAIVYSVACIYTGKGVSYSKVLSVVPKVWKRLMITLLWAYLGIFLFEVMCGFIIIFLIVLTEVLGVLMIPFDFLFSAVMFISLAFVILVWDMAGVVSVLEEAYGLAALKKSWQLLKGKRVTGMVLVILYLVFSFCTSLSFQRHVVDTRWSIWGRTVYASFLVSIFSAMWMMSVVVKSVLYFVCKAYQHESVDRYALSDILDGYLGEYMPLKDPIPLETLDA